MGSLFSSELSELKPEVNQYFLETRGDAGELKRQESAGSNTCCGRRATVSVFQTTLNEQTFYTWIQLLRCRPPLKKKEKRLSLYGADM